MAGLEVCLCWGLPGVAAWIHSCRPSRQAQTKLGFAGSRSLDTLGNPAQYGNPWLGFAGSRSLDTLRVGRSIR